MNTLNIPEGYQTVMPYLILKGAEQFLAFTASVFNATGKTKHMRDNNTIMHAEVQIGQSVIMVAESSEQWAEQTAGLFIYVNGVDDIYQKALAAGATSISEPQDQDYGRSSGIKDLHGNTWWITEAKK